MPYRKHCDCFVLGDFEGQFRQIGMGPVPILMQKLSTLVFPVGDRIICGGQRSQLDV